MRREPASENERIARAAANKSLSRYSLLLAPGIFGSLLGFVVYAPLDSGPLLGLGFCVLLLPLVMELVSVVRKRLSEDAGMLRTAYAVSGLALAALGFVVFFNGRLDSVPESVVTSTVIQKTIQKRKSTTNYTLTVSSWRPGRTEEDFLVGPRTFNRAAVGKTVRIELHPGYFGLPWSGGVSPE